MASSPPKPCCCSERSNQAAGADALDAGVALNADVLYEILLRVPAEALCRLRAVCRSWRNLLSDPRFFDAHAPRHPVLVATISDHDAGRVDVRDLSGNVVKRIRGTEHGALEAGATSIVVLSGSGSGTTVLDLATGAMSVLPGTSYAFGQVPSTGDYKVLRIHGGKACELLTLGAGGRGGHGQSQWRTAQRPPIHVEQRPRDRVVVKGVVYFLLELTICSSDLGNNGVNPDSIASFDLDTERWRRRLVRGPLTAHQGNSGDPAVSRRSQRIHLSLAELRGCLVAAHCNRRGYSLDLWFLTDAETGLWSKKYSIVCNYFVGCSKPLLALPALDQWRILLRLSDGALRVYDTRTNAYTSVTWTKGISAIGVYVGNLAFMKKQVV